METETEQKTTETSKPSKNESVKPAVENNSRFVWGMLYLTDTPWLFNKRNFSNLEMFFKITN